MEALFKAVHDEDGSVALGFLANPGEDPTDGGGVLRDWCDIGHVCRHLGKPVVAWYVDGDVVGECSRCLERSVRFHIADQEVSLA